MNVEQHGKIEEMREVKLLSDSITYHIVRRKPKTCLTEPHNERKNEINHQTHKLKLMPEI